MNQNVREFNISMNEALLSNRLNTATNLIDNSAGYGLLEALMSEF